MEMLIGGTWPRAASGQAGAAAWRRTPAHERMRILLRAAELADERAGLKASGIGKEGPRSAVAEMTDVKTVILPGRPW
jgi:acyl-CoA reductase-like NAD-dependent aldehyde dehydrogenase